MVSLAIKNAAAPSRALSRYKKALAAAGYASTRSRAVQQAQQALLKAGFNPSQPRDDGGRWSESGGGGGPKEFYSVAGNEQGAAAAAGSGGKRSWSVVDGDLPGDLSKPHPYGPSARQKHIATELQELYADLASLENVKDNDPDKIKVKREIFDNQEAASDWERRRRTELQRVDPAAYKEQFGEDPPPRAKPAENVGTSASGGALSAAELAARRNLPFEERMAAATGYTRVPNSSSSSSGSTTAHQSAIEWASAADAAAARSRSTVSSKDTTRTVGQAATDAAERIAWISREAASLAGHFKNTAATVGGRLDDVNPTELRARFKNIHEEANRIRDHIAALKVDAPIIQQGLWQQLISVKTQLNTLQTNPLLRNTASYAANNYTLPGKLPGNTASYLSSKKKPKSVASYVYHRVVG